MILLRHLRIVAFKHLRNIDLWFPHNGSILIEGHNESGKSTLFEAVYFALYGKALVGEEQGQVSLDALVPHGESRAGVQLTIQVGTTKLDITRTLTRGPQQVKHDAEAHIHRIGKPVETLSAVKAVNDCILTEMNGLDSNVLRNSCLMEQQALDRIETLSKTDREMAIAKLLGIDAIQQIERDLHVARKDEELLAQTNIRLEVARTHDEAQRAGAEAQRVEEALQAAKARAALVARDTLAAQLQTAQDNLDIVAGELATIRERSQRTATLEALRIQSDETARLLYTAEQDATALEVLRARQGQVTRPEEIAAAQDRVATLRVLEAELAQATRAIDAAGKSAQLAQYDADVAAATAREHAHRTRLAAATRRARATGLLAIIAFLAAIIAAAASLLAQLLWLLPVALIGLVISIVMFIQLGRLRSTTRAEHAKLATLERETMQLRATHEAIRSLGITTGEQAMGADNAEASPQVETAGRALNDTQSRIRAQGIEPTMTALAAERIAAEQALARMIQQAQQAESSPAHLAVQQQRATATLAACERALRKLADALAAAGIVIPARSDAPESVANMRQAHEAMTQPLQAALARMDVQTTQRQQGSLDTRAQHLRALHGELAAQRDEERRRLVALLAEQGVTATGDEPMEALSARWAALANEADPDALVATLERARAIAEQLRQQVEKLSRQHGLDTKTLDAAACQKAYDELARELRQRRLAAEMADEVFRRIVQRVLPETEMHMRALLPDLTDGRYRDVTLLSDGDHTADLRIRVWDEQAGRFVGKRLFSGGTRDQVSLALRLAFALATLPKELGAMPGFIFLDEPLSSFDDRRSQALVDVLTRGPIARQFPQVFLISHSQSFDPAAFTCSLRMANGRVTTTTLPDKREALALWEAGLTPAAN
jgi:DNA repair exonuclease SbcCD ATPase subunit